MRTLEQEWERYYGMVYPKGSPPEQQQETRQAFVAGMITMFNQMQKIGFLDDNELEVAITNLKTELTTLKDRELHKFNARN